MAYKQSQHVTAPRSRRAITGSYFHHETSPVSKVVCKVIVAAEFEERNCLCFQGVCKSGCCVCSMGGWLRGFFIFSALLLNVCVSLCSGMLVGRQLAKKENTAFQRKIMEDNSMYIIFTCAYLHLHL